MLNSMCLFIGILLLSCHPGQASDPSEESREHKPRCSSSSTPFLEMGQKETTENIINSYKIVLLSFPLQDGFETAHQHLDTFYQKNKIDIKYNLYEKRYQQRFPLTNYNSVLLVEDLKENFIRALLGGFKEEEGAKTFLHLIQQGLTYYNSPVLPPKFIAPGTTTYGKTDIHNWPL